jgi:nucleoside-diphosphate kinase
VIHGSDSPERAAEEVALFFEPSELVDWERTQSRWVVEAAG